MAVLYGAQMAKLRGPNPSTPAPGFVDGSVRHFVETVTFAAQATADTIEVARLPKGAIPLHVHMLTDTSTGTATIALGVSGATAKYKTAAAYTTTGVWTEMYGTTPATALGVALANEEILFLTIAAAALPASGTLRIHIVYAFN
jgi:6,7-dimethyl-8-ribityllumazine synthase